MEKMYFEKMCVKYFFKFRNFEMKRFFHLAKEKIPLKNEKIKKKYFHIIKSEKFKFLKNEKFQNIFSQRKNNIF